MRKSIVFLVVSFFIIMSFNTKPTFAADDSLNATIQLSVEQKITERINRGFDEFSGLRPGKHYSMYDENSFISKTLVELINETNSLSGYMVVDHDNFDIVEFSLGDTHPLQNIYSNMIYYLGPVSYAVTINSNELKELKSDQVYNKTELQNLKKESLKKSLVLEEPPGISTQNITDYSYKVINGVPDYQQNDNTSMNNDCVPTSAANVLMYWRNNGFSNISTTNSWKTVANRIGVIMGHTDADGVSRSRIVPGLKTFLQEVGYSNSFTISRDTTPTFPELRALVNGGDPSMLSVNGWNGTKGGHNITLVGYEEYYDPAKIRWYQSVIVRDNWASTPKDVWFQFNTEDIDDIYKIVR